MINRGYSKLAFFFFKINDLLTGVLAKDQCISRQCIIVTSFLYIILCVDEMT